MDTHPIKTYSGESFRSSFMQPGDGVNTILHADFGRFFIVPVEQLIRLIKLPVPPTRVTNHTIIYLTEGEGNISIGSQSVRFRQDECVVVPAGQVFSFEREENNRGYLCNFHPDFMIGKIARAELLRDFSFLRIWGNPHIRLDHPSSTHVAHLFQRLLHGYAAHGLTYPDILQANLIALLCELNLGAQPTSTAPQTHAVTIANQFRELLFEHIKTTHRVSDYADRLHITPNHLNKCVRSVTGKSPTRWIDEAIILEAKVLLHQSSLSVSDITAEVGLLDQSYFSRLFKKYEGITPLAFRRQIHPAQE
ncbi:putative HTH-type transcriptional regulator yisR [Fibrisoma limi BUZ 3]|uniref:Putative HTH-type transcriptional regulator yisR n=1 Tax=Fibrisoma limi BUZ 3 TaxID=1185876 RepID=I2GHK6_9BACT|nr:helix-turn-helix domain-containing protein [Fibrisoma limi]CCH53381.1 putative HTH-type transcriptional regulator yisR [Fibrisoma limi BUZ 3]